MDQILAKASNQAVTFAIRSGISLASGYAIKQISSFVEKLPDSERKRITAIKDKIQTKINILTVSIDLIKLAAARGNTTLESTVCLIDELQDMFDKFDKSVVDQLKNSNERGSIQKVESQMIYLLNQINEAIPIINLSLATSGVNLRGEILANKISPGRLIQASSHVINSTGKTLGPRFDLVMYTIFYNADRVRNTNDPLSAITWKETFARCQVTIVRNEGFNCSLHISEDFNDGRYHDENEEKPQVKSFDISLIESMFFSASGKLLKLESRNSPVLVIKLRDEDNEEWIALGEKNIGEFDSDDKDEDGDDEENEDDKSKKEPKGSQQDTSISLSLLEYILRLAKVQQIEDKPLLEIKDEILSLYLHDETSPKSEIVPTLREKKANRLRKDNVDTKATLNSNINRLENLDIAK